MTASVVQLPESKLVIDVLDISSIVHPEINKYAILTKQPGPNMPVISGADLECLLGYMHTCGLFIALKAPAAKP